MTPASRTAVGGDDHRLPTTVEPRRYELEISPDLDAGTFSGTVDIEVDLQERTDTIVLHALDLDIGSARVLPHGSSAVEAAIELEPEHEWVRLVTAKPLEAGQAAIHLAFAGELNEQLVGFYRSTYRRDGTERPIAVTQFESTHARRAFPCFDEPAYKASFGISLVVPEDMLAVSNAAELSRDPVGDGLVRVRFADTVPMSTYLVAFVVGALEVTEARPFPGRAGPVPLRVVHLPGQGRLCSFALEVATGALGFFEDYYDIAYPGDKVDLVAVPDFAFGAMENLGCIVFREVLLVVDPDSSTPQELQRVADVINHELAHMWFGDLVTMRWWNGIWLNEAFATFMEVKATDAFRPEWDVWTTFGLSRTAAFETDALRSTRPVEYEVVTAADAEGMFDVLTYEKGCSVVRMLEQYLGAEVFRDGIRAYLRRHAWSSTDTTDLWDALEEASGEPVRRIMDSWIFRGGHPLVTVDAVDGAVELSQQRATYSPRAEDLSTAWPVPMVLELERLDGSAFAQRICLEGSMRLELDEPAPVVRPNGAGNGFFRTLHSDELRRALATRGGEPLERFVLVDDVWFAAVAGLTGLEPARETIEILSGREDNPAIWRRISAICDELSRLMGPSNREEVAGWVRDLVSGPMEHFPVAGAGPGREAEVAATLFALRGTVGEDPRTRETADALFEDALYEDRQVAPAVAAAALTVVARGPTPEQREEIERRWRAAADPQEEQRNLAALVSTGDPGQFDSALELTADDVRSQDAPYLVRRALENPDLGGRAWSWLVEHWTLAVERYPSSAIPRMLGGVRSFTDEELAVEVTRFLDQHPVETGELQVRQHLERMRAGVLAAQRLRG